MIEIRVRYTKAAQANVDLRANLQRPMVLAESAAKRVSTRVVTQGKTATPAKPYSTRSRSYTISDAYGQQLGVTKTRYRNSQEFHAAVGTRTGAFRVSGGMWAGLQVRNVGSTAALIDFAGSSIGSTRQSGKTKTGRQRKSPVKVRNQAKGAIVFNQSEVNVLQMTQGEEEALVGAVTRWSQNIVGRIFGATSGQFSTTGDQQLLQDILRHYDGSK